MSDPLVPNFKKGVGRLATDRFDFEDHVEGDAFRHHADQIDLVPNVVIGTNQTNVQSAIEALKNALTVPLIPDATLTTKGVIQLTGDIGGTATSITVIGLRGFPINTTPPNTGDVLAWGGSNWGPTPAGGAIVFNGDVTGTAGATTVVKINGKPVSSAVPSLNNVLTWNGTTWVPAATISAPTGTGFATVTSSAFDSTATGNIRYTGGKFQTDTNIQFKNSSITGDLAWAPTASPKTLTLPNVTDTIVARTTSDTLTNKTISAASNTITDSGTAVGDLLRSDGTKFARFARGAALQVLRTNAGGTDIEWAAASGIGVTVSGTGFVTATSGNIDTTATANIRYTPGGHFQTDSTFSLQFKNGSFVGDLSWSPTAGRLLTLPDATDTLVGQSTTDTLTNKTLIFPIIATISNSGTITIPTGTDTLVARATSDTLTNKTINATNNTITDTSTATGDLLKSNGTKFVRFARGSALQVLRVNAGGTDLEFAAPAGGGASSAGAVGKVQLSDGAGGFTASTGMLDNGTNVRFSLPLSGSSTDSVPFRFKVARLTYTGQLTLTMTAAQYECPILFLDGTTQAGSSYLVTPQSDGMWLNVYNGTDGTISVKSNFSSVDLPNNHGAVCFLDALPSNNKMRGVTSAIVT